MTAADAPDPAAVEGCRELLALAAQASHDRELSRQDEADIATHKQQQQTLAEARDYAGKTIGADAAALVAWKPDDHIPQELKAFASGFYEHFAWASLPGHDEAEDSVWFLAFSHRDDNVPQLHLVKRCRSCTRDAVHLIESLADLGDAVSQ